MINKDWVGNSKSVYGTLGATNHAVDKDRHTHDLYTSDPKALEKFMTVYDLPRDIWEPSAGHGHLVKCLRDKGFNVVATDLYDYPEKFVEMDSGVDFFQCSKALAPNILTNPPYKLVTSYIVHALDILPSGGQLILLLKIQALEGKERFEKIYKNKNLKYVYVNISRVCCYKNGDMSCNDSSAVCYGWFVFEKGFTGEPVIRWC